VIRQAALQGKPLDVSVTLMDGTTQTVAVDAASTSSEVCEKICRATNLKDRFGFGIFVSMQNKVSYQIRNASVLDLHRLLGAKAQGV